MNWLQRKKNSYIKQIFKKVLKIFLKFLFYLTLKACYCNVFETISGTSSTSVDLIDRFLNAPKKYLPNKVN